MYTLPAADRRVEMVDVSRGGAFDFDLIVVGGGHNGLVCAAYVAAAGFRVCVLERHSRVGGAALTEEFHPGFRNSVASYTVSLLQPKIIADLDLAAHGLRIVPRPMDNFVPSLAGPGLELPADIGARLAAIARHSRRDAASYSKFARELDAVTSLLRPMLLEAPVEPAAGAHELGRSLRLLGRVLSAGPRAAATSARLLGGSAGAWLERYFETDLLLGALGFDSIVGNFASPYDAGSAYLLLHHSLGQVNGRLGGWGHAIGGMGAIADALAGACAARGVVIETGQAVSRVAEAAGGWEVHAGGHVRTARAVASAIHPQTFFLGLLDSAGLPAAFVERMRGWRSESASFRLNVALAELPDFTCRPGTRASDHHGAGILIAPSLAYLASAHASALDAGISAEPVIELVIPSTIDDTLAPRGAHVASLFCQHFRYSLPGGRSWDTGKEAAIERVIDTVDRFAPNFRRAVVAVEAYSPADLERRFGLVGGDIFHGTLVRGQLYRNRPARGYARYRAPIPHLYMCASGTHPGGGVSGAPGHNAAAAILDDWAAPPPGGRPARRSGAA